MSQVPSYSSPAFRLTAEGEQPDLSVVLINWRMGKDLVGLMPSLATHVTNLATVEVLVVNKPSNDGTEELCAGNPWIRLIEHPDFGIAEMRNVGIRHSRGRICLMLDADTEILPGCFDALVGFMNTHPEVAAAGAHTRRPDGEVEHNIKRFYDLGTIIMRRTPLGRLWPSNPWIRHHLMLDRDKTTSFLGDWIAGACFCMRREALEDVGLFDERYYFGFEDVDWCWRAKRFGWRVAFCAEARIIHKVQRKSARGINRLTVEHIKSGLHFLAKTRRLRLGYPDDTVRLEYGSRISGAFRGPVETAEP
jgi:GT2 family glycosyltransferase